MKSSNQLVPIVLIVGINLLLAIAIILAALPERTVLSFLPPRRVQLPNSQVSIAIPRHYTIRARLDCSLVIVDDIHALYADDYPSTQAEFPFMLISIDPGRDADSTDLQSVLERFFRGDGVPPSEGNGEVQFWVDWPSEPEDTFVRGIIRVGEHYYGLWVYWKSIPPDQAREILNDLLMTMRVELDDA